MIAELLRRGHEGRILSAVCVRYRKDLAYNEQHAVLVERYPNYRYLPLTTREPENEGDKVYIQDLLASGKLETELGVPPRPSRHPCVPMRKPGHDRPARVDRERVGLPGNSGDLSAAP